MSKSEDGQDLDTDAALKVYFDTISANLKQKVGYDCAPVLCVLFVSGHTSESFLMLNIIVNVSTEFQLLRMGGREKGGSPHTGLHIEPQHGHHAMRPRIFYLFIYQYLFIYRYLLIIFVTFLYVYLLQKTKK